jgi:hypothetical protein
MPVLFDIFVNDPQNNFCLGLRVSLVYFIIYFILLYVKLFILFMFMI